MLVAYRLAGLSALETYYAGVGTGAQTLDRVWLRGLWPAAHGRGRVNGGLAEMPV